MSDDNHQPPTPRKASTPPEAPATPELPRVPQVLRCTEVWGGTGGTDISVKLVGARGECYSLPFDGSHAGGDIHFLSVCGESLLTKVVLADVSGHGAESAEVSSIIHGALVETLGAHDNSSMLKTVNDAFLQRRRGKFRFTTMVSLILDSADRSLVYAYAGHPSVIRGRASTGKFEAVRPEDRRATGLPLGILSGTEYEQHSVQLEQGDILVIYTDAFSEARGDDGEMLGEDGLARLLEGADSMEAYRIKEHVLNALEGRFDDDVTLIVLEIL